MAGVAQPAKLKLLKGRGNGTDSGGRKVPASPKFRRVAPSPPSWLSREAKAEWRRVLPELMRLELVKAEDRAALAAYCEDWSTFVEATRTVQREGLTIHANQGLLAHPAVGIANKKSAALRAWVTHFGLSPSAEGRLSVGEGADGGDENPFAG